MNKTFIVVCVHWNIILLLQALKQVEVEEVDSAEDQDEDSEEEYDEDDDEAIQDKVEQVKPKKILESFYWKNDIGKIKWVYIFLSKIYKTNNCWYM